MRALGVRVLALTFSSVDVSGPPLHAPSLFALAERLMKSAQEDPDASTQTITLAKTAADLIRAVNARPDDMQQKSEGTLD